MTTQPDYPGLVRLLPTLHHLVDASGMVTLEPPEAESVNRLGFPAQPGPWRVPPLPTDLVDGNPLLEPLGDDQDPFWHPRQSESVPGHRVETVEQGQVKSVGLAAIPPPQTPDGAPESSEIRNPAWNKEGAAILVAIGRAGGSIERRKLQKKLWRIRAERFNGAIHRLATEGLIKLDGNLLILCED
jgi:hypothetical protein